MTPQKFRKKPVVVEAMRNTTSNWKSLQQWMGDAFVGCERCDGPGEYEGEFGPVGCQGCMAGAFQVRTLWADWGDWIIKGVAGEFYPCKPDIFEVTYEAAE